MLEDTTANPAAGLVMPHPAGGSTGGYGIPSAGRAPLPSASECKFGTATAACRGWPSWFSLEAAADELRSVETPSEFLRVCVLAQLWLICLAGEGVSAWRWGYKLKRISDTIRSGSMQRRPSAMAHSESQGLEKREVIMMKCTQRWSSPRLGRYAMLRLTIGSLR